MISHALIMLALIGVGVLENWLGIHPVWIAWTIASFALIYREITQREYQIIEASPSKLRRDLKYIDALKVWDWNKHSILQTLVAIGAGGLAAALIQYFNIGSI